MSGGQTVNKAASSTAVSSSANPSTYGQSVTFTATVNPSSATGTMQFKIDGSNFGTPVALSSGSGTSGATSTLSVDNHTVTAIYSGDPNYMTSTGTLSGGQTVNPVSQYTLSLTKVGNGSVNVNGTSHTLPWSGTFPSGSVCHVAGRS